MVIIIWQAIDSGVDGRLRGDCTICQVQSSDLLWRQGGRWRHSGTRLAVAAVGLESNVFIDGRYEVRIAQPDVRIVHATATTEEMKCELLGLEVKVPISVFEIRLTLSGSFLEAVDHRLALGLVLVECTRQVA